ncbi:hypothetical protein EG359_18040 [Chryseobacterium joostei]|uniref:Lipoprotein n=1 Tax=Chryseobacterium joostei TaxID=112234 RepID=A0A1N7K3Z2_9FLAO|nr:hypothetical protein [Chryseobacterium joostei]AZB01399.1 hypothetical protein EG359_18040 [Chryseobacterium joostei]SIS56315.1 hypothetical protein SAMN05421768_11018 [Chryseobacterium joostei]
MRNKIWNSSSYILVVIFFIFSACKNRSLNYVNYYNRVNEIDSIYRLQKDTLVTIKEYKKLFRKYPPKNQDRIEEFTNYIILADKKDINFGGKKNLKKLITLIAPYHKKNKDFYWLYQKYGIDSLEVEQTVAQWKKNLNQKLIDSFTVAFKRDQDSRRSGNSLDIFKNDEKNAKLLKWMFENDGFPSIQKIGLWNGDFFMPSGPVLLHMADYDEYQPYFKAKILEYIKSGDCPPRDYAAMIDRNNIHHKQPYTYGVYQGYENIKDTITVNRNRKSIGLPSIQHAQAIIKDFAKKNKKEK